MPCYWNMVFRSAMPLPMRPAKSALRLTPEHGFRGFDRGIGGRGAHVCRRLGFRQADFLFRLFRPALNEFGHARMRLAGDAFGFRMGLRDDGFGLGLRFGAPLFERSEKGLGFRPQLCRLGEFGLNS